MGKSSAGLLKMMSFTRLARLAVDASLKFSNTLLTFDCLAIGTNKSKMLVT